MTSPSLRTRLLVAVGAISLLIIAASFVIVGLLRAQLVAQIDDRLALVASTNEAATPSRSGTGGSDGPPAGGRTPTRPLDIYDGILDESGALTTRFTSERDGVEFPPPALDIVAAIEASGEPITVDATGGDLRYRLIAAPTDDQAFVVSGLPMDGVDGTASALVQILAVAVVTIVGALAAATWWVVRLGIAPLQRMTRTVEAIAAADLSDRIEGIDGSTEAGQLADAFNTMLGRIETSFAERVEAEDRLRRFLADASHELRTPVATIRGYAELYRAGGLRDQVALDDAMHRTEAESQRMSRLIHDMLNLANVDRSPALDTESVDLDAIARDAAADASVRRPDRRIVTRVSPFPLTVDADADLLRQIVSNLVDNALAHTEPPGSVTVEAWSSQGHAHFKVTDEGPGMPPRILGRAAERFFRADPSRNRKHGGSGLGLAIVQAAVAAHGGTFLLASEPTKGTEAEVVLPLIRRDSTSQETLNQLQNESQVG